MEITRAQINLIGIKLMEDNLMQTNLIKINPIGIKLMEDNLMKINTTGIELTDTLLEPMSRLMQITIE